MSTQTSSGGTATNVQAGAARPAVSSSCATFSRITCIIVEFKSVGEDKESWTTSAKSAATSGANSCASSTDSTTTGATTTTATSASTTAATTEPNARVSATDCSTGKKAELITDLSGFLVIEIFPKFQMQHPFQIQQYQQQQQPTLMSLPFQQVTQQTLDASQQAQLQQAINDQQQQQAQQQAQQQQQQQQQQHQQHQLQLQYQMNK